MEGDRTTKLYLDEYAKMGIDGVEVQGEFIDEGMNKGRYQHKGNFEFGGHRADLRIMNFENREVSRGDLKFEIVPSLAIKDLSVESAKKVASREMEYIAERNPGIKSIVGAKEEGASLTVAMVKDRVVLKTASTEQVLAPTITLKADGTVELAAKASNLEDGPHTATVEVLDEGGKVIDFRQKVFIVDTISPEILLDQIGDLKHRVGRLLLTKTKVVPVSAQIIAIPIKEEGSGVERVEVEETVRVRTIIKSSSPYQQPSLGWQEEKRPTRTFREPVLRGEGAQLLFPLEIEALPYGEHILKLAVYDRAGNVGERTYQFKSYPVKISREIGSGIEEGSKKIRQYCYWITYGGTSNSGPAVYGSGSIGMDAPLYIKTYKYTVPKSGSPYPNITLDEVEEPIGWRVWKVTQTRPATDTVEAVLRIEGPEYIDFTVKDHSIIREEPGPREVREIYIGLKVADLRVNLFYNSKANSLDASWKGRTARDLFLVLDLDGMEIIPTGVREDGFQYSPIGEGDHQVTLSVYDRLSNKWTKLEGEFSVNTGEPEISDFRYIPEDDVFSARISDRGTELRDLEVGLYINGQESIFEFDHATGQLMAFLDDKPDIGVVKAQLFVTDKAGNRVTSIAKAQFYTPGEGALIGRASTDVSLDIASIPLGWTMMSKGAGCIRKYKRRGDCWVTLIEECRRTRRGIGALIGITKPEIREMLREIEEEKEKEKEGISMPTFQEMVEKQEKESKGISLAFGSGYGGREAKGFLIDILNRIRGGYYKRVTTREIDTCPPIISALRYDEGGHKVRAMISDRSTPFSDLRIRYGDWRYGGLAFDLLPATGEFRGDLPIDDREIYRTSLSVNDGYSWAHGNLTIRIPKRPPDVSLSFDEFSGSENRDFLNSLGLEHLLVGEYSDISGIDEGLTELEVDGVIKRNFVTYGRKPTMLLYLADLADGRHRARLRVVDNVGLENEANLVFDINYRPHIYNFAYQGNVEGAPVFVAFIKDRGFDVTKEGIDLSLDGRQIPRSQYYYNQETGFFSASGPIEITEESHRAVLTVVDGRGNRAEQGLTFGGPLAVELPSEAIGGVRITGYSAWDFQGNADGRINPGERVRLFVEVLSDMDIAQARGLLRITHPYITIERDQAEYGDIQKGKRTESAGGFDLLIKDEFFSNTNIPVEEVDCALTLTDKEARQWVLPLKIPVYKTPAIFKDFVGPKQTSISLEVIQPQDGGFYDNYEMPCFADGRFIVTGSSISSITATLNGMSLPVSINSAAGTFRASLERAMNRVFAKGRGACILIVRGRNSAGDEAVKIISFYVICDDAAPHCRIRCP
ncbi:MAG: hypothetical protein JRI46_11095 [Deltaproteobacteria bacterium]|nr:hypothetical protein [Deltaproteobacteria bacterium]